MNDSKKTELDHWRDATATLAAQMQVIGQKHGMKHLLCAIQYCIVSLFATVCRGDTKEVRILVEAFIRDLRDAEAGLKTHLRFDVHKFRLSDKDVQGN